ncbi:MAG: ShlB/FhaC/HecB family hemolysin secretion/activation protein [Alphaproteobacteria bacterium]|nr:ShlB/FhaC/HecB family hemolysin secretion/activation protein [Alphaproteobacteria bacterium]
MTVNTTKNITIFSVLLLVNIFCGQALAKEDEQEQLAPINQNLLMPNEAVNSMTDIGKARSVYNLRNMQNAQSVEEKTEEKETSSDDEEIKLPPRTKKDDIFVHISQVEISRSEVFSEVEIKKFESLLKDKEATAEDINNLINLINVRYLKKGIVTARAFIEEGSLNDGVLKIELMEAHIGKLEITGNKYHHTWFLRSQITNKDGDLFNLNTLRKDLNTFNRNARSVKMRAELKPGEKYGTTDVKMIAEESFPYHLSTSFDNFGRDTTGEHRGGLVASSDSLLGFQDRLSLAFNMSRSSSNPYVDYSIPINRSGTRVGVSYMYGKSEISLDDNNDFDLTAKSRTLSGYLTHPLINTLKAKLNLNTSVNAKNSHADISDITYSKYKGRSVAIGLGGNYNFNKSVLYASSYLTSGVIEDHIKDEDHSFSKVNADLYYIHYLPSSIVGTFKAGGQYSPDNMAYLEQYQIGGISSVRGYSEGGLMAPSAYYTSLEMLFPIPFLPETISIPCKKFRLKDSIKFATFVDHGGVFYHDKPTEKENFLLSAGVGLRFALSKYISARFYVGFPLMNKKAYQESDAAFHFDIIAVPF